MNSFYFIIDCFVVLPTNDRMFFHEIPHFVRDDSISFLEEEKSAASPHFSPPKTETNVIPKVAKRKEESQPKTISLIRLLRRSSSQ